MIADRLLSKLDKVKQTGKGRWIARCPAHDDRRASFLISEGTSRSDGVETVRIHCFAGCDKETILSSVGLTFSDLYPERPLSHHVKPQRKPFNAYDVLECCASEILVAAIVVADAVGGKRVTEADKERLWLAAQRLTTAAEVAHGKY